MLYGLQYALRLSTNSSGVGWEAGFRHERKGLTVVLNLLQLYFLFKETVREPVMNLLRSHFVEPSDAAQN